MQSPWVGPPEPLTTPISISRNLNYGIPRVHDKWHHHALFDKYRCILNGGTCNHSVVQSLLPILYVLVNLFSCINEDILNIISTEEAIRYSVNNKALFHLYLAPLSTTGMVTGKHIMKILQNNSHHSRPALKGFVSSLAARPSSAPIFIHTATDQKLGSSRRPAWKHGSFISERTDSGRQTDSMLSDPRPNFMNVYQLWTAYQLQQVLKSCVPQKETTLTPEVKAKKCS